MSQGNQEAHDAQGKAAQLVRIPSTNPGEIEVVKCFGASQRQTARPQQHINGCLHFLVPQILKYHHFDDVIIPYLAHAR